MKKSVFFCCLTVLILGIMSGGALGKTIRSEAEEDLPEMTGLTYLEDGVLTWDPVEGAGTYLYHFSRKVGYLYTNQLELRPRALDLKLKEGT